MYERTRQTHLMQQLAILREMAEGVKSQGESANSTMILADSIIGILTLLENKTYFPSEPVIDSAENMSKY